jgi:glycosyltransferase involved in cell wall biosynthesis
VTPGTQAGERPARVDNDAAVERLVSVVIPAYNCGRFIGDALESVFAQNYPALEVFVVDDGSTDDTCDVVSHYGDRVTLVRQRNAGAAVARNEGIRRARGKYVAFLDADDFWLPGKLRLQIDYLERHPETDMCCTRWHLLHPDAAGNYHIEPAVAPESAPVDSTCSGWIYCELLLGCAVWTSTVVMRRSLSERLGGFDPELRRGQDYDYWLRASRLTPIDRLDARLAAYRIEPGAQGRKSQDTNWELSVIRRAIERWGTAGPDGRALPEAELRTRLWALNFSFGYDQFRKGRHATAGDAFAAALRERPTHVKSALYFLASGLLRLGAPKAARPRTPEALGRG